MRKGVLLAAVFAAALWAKPAMADTVAFDFNGGGAGGGVAFDVMDWQPGNSMLIENGTITVAPAGSPGSVCTGSCTPILAGNARGLTPGLYGTGRILVQSNLTGLIDSNTSTVVFTQGTGGNFFTTVAAFDVLITGDAAGTFYIQPGGTFRIYAVGANGDNLNGTGFVSGAAACGAASTCILEAGASLNILNKGNDSGTTPPTFEALDQTGTNNYTGVSTVALTGGVHVEATVTAFNPAYFGNLLIGTTLAISDTHSNAGYHSTNPSAAFSSNAIANGDRIGAGTPNQAVAPFGATNLALCGPGGAAACINGTGTDILVETDVNTSFRGVSAIPEPATLTLLGLGLLGSGAARRRLGRKAAK